MSQISKPVSTNLPADTVQLSPAQREILELKCKVGKVLGLVSKADKCEAPLEMQVPSPGLSESLLSKASGWLKSLSQ